MAVNEQNEATSPEVIKVVAATVFDAEGRMLLVRKKNSRFFMQPGGKPEPGETEVQALARELHEEIGCHAAPEAITFCRKFYAPAANEHGCFIDASVYHVDLQGPVRIAAEIEESVWADINEARQLPLAELTRMIYACKEDGSLQL